MCPACEIPLYAQTKGMCRCRKIKNLMKYESETLLNKYWSEQICLAHMHKEEEVCM